MDRVNGTVMEDNPLEAAGALLGAAMTQVATGQRTVYGGHRWGSLKRAIEALGVQDEDLVSIEANVGQGGRGLYVVDEEPGGIKAIKEVCR